jgi:acyl-CoA thioesterase FadM
VVKDFTGCMHVGNHVLISHLSEAQARLLAAIGFPELNVDEKVCISTNLSADFLSEVHYGDTLIAPCRRRARTIHRRFEGFRREAGIRVTTLEVVTLPLYSDPGSRDPRSRDDA